MFRSFCSLTLCWVWGSVGVAQQAQMRPNPVRVQAGATWEYGNLIYAPRPAGPIWLSADTSISRMLDSAENQPDQPGRAGPAPLIRVLNVLGARGWELVSAPSTSRDVSYWFKREVSPATRNATTR